MTEPITSTTTSTPAAVPEASLEPNSFDEIFARYGQQRAAQANDDVEPAPGETELHLSDVGYLELPLSGARFARLTSRQTQSMARDATVLEQHQVDQLVVHGFGWDYDQPHLLRGQVGPPVEAGSGYDPEKVSRALQQMLSGARQAPHCLITRRGDLYCLLPWSRASRLPGPRASTSDIPSRAIAVSLEMRYSTAILPFDPRRADAPVALAEPITAAQEAVLAFLAKKLATWAGLTSLPVFTGAGADILTKLGAGGAHASGMVSYAAYDLGAIPSSIPELLLPPGWALGAAETLPEELRTGTAAPAWGERVAQVYPVRGYGPGNIVSSWTAVLERFDALPAFDFATQLFAPADVGRVFDVQTPTSALAASNERSRVVTGEGYQRAYDMSMSTRSRLYDAASVALDAVVIATMEKEARDRSAMTGVTHVAITQSALGFDFALGEWLYADVPVEPSGGSLTISAPPTQDLRQSRPGAHGNASVNSAPRSDPNAH